MSESTSVIPTMRYNDADAAIAWLEKALGFSQHAVYRNPETQIVMHAELLLRRKNGGVGMVMLGDTRNGSEMATHYRVPKEVGGVTGSVYVIVDDCDPVWAAAQAANAEVVIPLRTMDYGGKAFTLRDPEGQLWSVGEFDPFAIATSKDAG